MWGRADRGSNNIGCPGGEEGHLCLVICAAVVRVHRLAVTVDHGRKHCTTEPMWLGLSAVVRFFGLLCAVVLCRASVWRAGLYWEAARGQAVGGGDGVDGKSYSALQAPVNVHFR